MKSRVQVLLTMEERERFRQAAAAQGASLSTWLREAGIERLRRHREGSRIRSADDLRAFFATCDEQTRGAESEPDWDEHREVMRESRRRGVPEA